MNQSLNTGSSNVCDKSGKILTYLHHAAECFLRS